MVYGHVFDTGSYRKGIYCGCGFIRPGYLNIQAAVDGSIRCYFFDYYRYIACYLFCKISLIRYQINPIKSSLTASYPHPIFCLKIPDAEVRDIFQNSVVEWFNERSVKSDRHLLFQALWNSDADKLSELLSDLLFNTISYHDNAESYYHAFLTGLFSSAGYIVESNYESGFGRPDLMIKDRKTRSAVIIEVKISNSREQLLQDGQKALEQIETKQYAQKTKQDGFRNVVCYGISFFKKQCLVQIS